MGKFFPVTTLLVKNRKNITSNSVKLNLKNNKINYTNIIT